MFCQLCQSVFRYYFDLDQGKSIGKGTTPTHHHTWASLFDPACEDCEICTKLRDELPDGLSLQFLQNTRDRETRCTEHSSIVLGNGQHVTFVFCGRHPGIFSRQVRYVIQRMPPELLLGASTLQLTPSRQSNEIFLPAARTPAADRGTGGSSPCETTRAAKTWLDHCLYHHRRCQTFDATSWLPTRLLDLGPVDEPLRIRLRVTAHSPLAPGVRYATLSHRWGIADFPRLLKRDLDQPNVLFAPDKVPKTFIDAMQFTRSLGVQFIWIDSLCIAQDSKQDWRCESRMMGDIYKHGIFNVSATAAIDSSAGCFFTRSSSSSGPFFLFSNIGEKQAVVTPEIFWGTEVEDAPLNSRGWVLQERILSPRIFHFCKERLFWECRQHRSCEGFPPTLSSSFLWVPGVSHIKDLCPSFQIQDYGGDDSKMEWDYWGRVVTAYSKCSLTNVEDKLLALSGIATEVQRLVKDVYVAGLWKSHLPYELLWYARSPYQTNDGIPHRYQTYVAPSWSWASIQGEIVYPEEIWDVYCTLDRRGECISDLEVEVTHLDENTTGQILSGSIKLLGKLGTMSWTWDETDLRSASLSSLTVSRTATRLSEYVEMATDNLTWDIEVGPGSVSHVWLDDLSVDILSTAAFFLPIYLQASDYVQEMEGLLLLRSDSDDRFTRIGKFTTEYWKVHEIYDALDKYSVVII